MHPSKSRNQNWFKTSENNLPFQKIESVIYHWYLFLGSGEDYCIENRFQRNYFPQRLNGSTSIQHIKRQTVAQKIK